jgi:hypothetical protein
MWTAHRVFHEGFSSGSGSTTARDSNNDIGMKKKASVSEVGFNDV